MKRKWGPCSECDQRASYSWKYDAHFCKQCDTWMISKCGDPKCEFRCYERPDKPSEATDLEEEN